MKPPRSSVCEGNFDENGDYYTPDGDHGSQIKTHTAISPEDSIVRLVSSKIISNGSPKTHINLKKGLKRMRNVTHSDFIPSLVTDGIASRVITPSTISLPMSLSKNNNIISDNPITSLAIEAEAQLEVDVEVNVEVDIEVGKQGVIEANTEDQYDSKKRKILIIEEITSIRPTTESEKVIVSTCSCLFICCDLYSNYDYDY